MSRPSHELQCRLLPSDWFRLAEDPFTLGVAAGEPSEEGALLWTRLATRPDLPNGGMSPRPELLYWEVASDDEFRRIVARGTALAVPAHAHSVHVRVGGLLPAGIYWFRFRCGRFLSPSGLLRTLPSTRCHVESVQLAIALAPTAGTGSAELGALARDDLELAVLVHAPAKLLELSASPTPGDSIEELRRGHAEALQSPALRLLRQRVMTLPAWTDHGGSHRRRSAASAQAFWEHHAVCQREALRSTYFRWGSLLEMQLGPGVRARASRRAAWTLATQDDRVSIASRHGGLLRSDEAPFESRLHLAARSFHDTGDGYLRCELTHGWARWECAPVAAKGA